MGRLSTPISRRGSLSGAGGTKLGDIRRALTQPSPTSNWSKCDGSIIPYSPKLSIILSPSPNGLEGAAGDAFGGDMVNAQPVGFCSGQNQTIIWWESAAMWVYRADGTRVTIGWMEAGSTASTTRMASCAWSASLQLFVAISYGGNIYQSANGETWTAVDTPAGMGQATAVTADLNGRVTILGLKPSSTSAMFVYSDDLTNWTTFMTDFNTSNVNFDPKTTLLETTVGTDGQLWMLFRLNVSFNFYSYKIKAYQATSTGQITNFQGGDQAAAPKWVAVNGLVYYVSYNVGNATRSLASYNPATHTYTGNVYVNTENQGLPMAVGKYVDTDGGPDQLIVAIDTVSNGTQRSVLSDNGKDFRLPTLAALPASRWTSAWGDKRGYYFVSTQGYGNRFKVGLQVPVVNDRDPQAEFYMKVA